MVGAAERDRKLIADLKAQGFRLRELQVVRVAGRLTTDKARLDRERMKDAPCSVSVPAPSEGRGRPLHRPTSPNPCSLWFAGCHLPHPVPAAQVERTSPGRRPRLLGRPPPAVCSSWEALPWPTPAAPDRCWTSSGWVGIRKACSRRCGQPRLNATCMA